MHALPRTAETTVIHIVDDDVAVRDSLHALLESYGYSVRTYGLAREFLEANPDGYSGCLLADLHMPEMTGIDLLAALGRKGIMGPAVAMTGRGDSRLRELAVSGGAYALLDKPVDEARLHEAIESALGRA